MSRREAVLCLVVAFILITAGVVWLAGPWGLIACGASLGVTTLLVNVEDREHGE